MIWYSTIKIKSHIIKLLKCWKAFVITDMIKLVLAVLIGWILYDWSEFLALLVLLSAVMFYLAPSSEKSMVIGKFIVKEVCFWTKRINCIRLSCFLKFLLKTWVVWCCCITIVGLVSTLGAPDKHNKWNWTYAKRHQYEGRTVVQPFDL